MPMTKREIAAVVRRVCESKYACPVYEAHRKSAEIMSKRFCSCMGFVGAECPFRDALELAAEEERRARKANRNIHHEEIDMRKVFKDRFMPNKRTVK